jgi:protein-S-isoprenylcysteine O-methyltransferase Ste14
VPPLYVTDPAAALVFWTACAIWALSELVTYVRFRSAPGAERRDRGSRAVVVIGFWMAIVLGIFAALAVPSLAIGWHRHLVFYAGVGLVLAGLLLRQYAIFTLGRLHTLDVTVRAGQTVVESGPYRWIRHPSYTGSLLTAAGILLCATNWLSLACYLLAIGAYIYRIRVEEKVLSEHLGDAYRRYMGRTKRLIPYLL